MRDRLPIRAARSTGAAPVACPTRPDIFGCHCGLRPLMPPHAAGRLAPRFLRHPARARARRRECPRCRKTRRQAAHRSPRWCPHRVAQVGGTQHGLGKAIGGGKAPQRCRQRIDDIPRAADLRCGHGHMVADRQGVDCRRQRRFRLRAQHLIARASKQRGAQLDREQPARIQRFDSGMSGARTVGRTIGQCVRTMRVIHRHRRQPHQRAIPGRARIGANAEDRAAIQIALLAPDARSRRYRSRHRCY